MRRRLTPPKVCPLGECYALFDAAGAIRVAALIRRYRLLPGRRVAGRDTRGGAAG